MIQDYLIGSCPPGWNGSSPGYDVLKEAPAMTATTSGHASEAIMQLSPGQAWARLEAGNRHWVTGRLEHPDEDAARRAEVAVRQDPFATIVSCIDSRLPPETVFDQGIGDLFAVRTGAQTIGGLITASIEYGPLENGTPLIVVMGHERCGAVTAAVHAIQSGARLPGHLDTIVQRLRPAYHKATGTTLATERDVAPSDDPAALIDQVVRAQILCVVNSLAHDGPLAALVRAGTLGIVGAYYDLDACTVTKLHALGL
jgi:carbonic anhydrase